MLNKLIRLLGLLAVGGAVATAQTTTYTGTIKDLSNNVVTSGQVTFSLTPPTDSTLLGTSRFVPTTIICTIQANGTILNQASSGACVVTSNTSLMPSGTAYKICVQPNYITPGSCFFDYAVTSSKDISTVIPTLGTGLLNYQGPAGPTGATGATGATGPAGPIASVFGRTTAAITAQTGDYTCSQITGAVCTSFSLYYQTVQASGVPQTPRAKLNFLPSTGTTFTCADNSGNNSTDCTVGATGLIPGSVTNATSSRSLGGNYQNTNGYMIYVSGYVTTSGSSWGLITCAVGPSAPSFSVYSNQSGATTSGQAMGFMCAVPAGWYYSITAGGSATSTLATWYETAVH